jgi:hypothetical protein
MAERLTTTLSRLLLVLGVLALPSSSSAHRLDEYLQATLVTIEPGKVRLQINLTPGVEVAEQVLAVIDRDHDGVISTNEARAYCELLKRELSVRLDHSKMVLKLTGSTFPPLSELGTGWGVIQMEFTATCRHLRPGAHRLTVKNRHLLPLSVYLLNATLPAEPVQITRQTRNETQSTGVIEFRL